MNDKEKQTEEMAKEIFNTCAWRFGKPNDYKEIFNDIAEDLVKLNYQKIPKDSIVLSKEEINNADYFYVKDGELIPVEKGRGKFITTEWYTELLMKMPLGHELAKERKETAEKIFKELKTRLKDCPEVIEEGYNVQNSVDYFEDIIGYDKFCADEIIKELAKQFGVEIKE